MGDWFVPPDTIKLDLIEGQWVLVKQRLNAGEQRSMFRRLYVAGVDGTLRVNPDTVATSFVLAYLVDWSLTDATGHKVEILQQPRDVVEAAVDALDPDKFKILKTAIEAHDEHTRQARDAEKKTRNGATTFPTISPLPVGSGGGMSGSAISTPTSIKS